MKDNQSPEKFSQKAIQEAKKLSFRLDESLFKNRKKINGVTIDSPSSKDLDDAIWIEKIENGWILHVSIADVSALVEPNSYLDKEAYEKVFTRYRKNFNDPMIPHILSENKLSLLQNEKRPTLTFSIPISKDFTVGEPIFSKTFLKSQKRFSYDEVDGILKSKKPHEYKSQLDELNYVTQRLQKQRRKQPVKRGSHGIVQESMILANEVIAQYCADHNIPILFRNQADNTKNEKKEEVLFVENEKTNHKNFLQKIKEKFRKTFFKVVLFCDEKNIPLFTQNYKDKIRNLSLKEFHYEVKNALQNPKEQGTSTVQIAVESVMQPAEYGIESKGHLGLDVDAYTHGTSPIRRYADLVNHRIFSVIAQHPQDVKEYLPYSSEELQAIADQINEVSSKEKKKNRKS